MKCYKCRKDMQVIDIEINGDKNTKIYKCEHCSLKIKLHYKDGKVRKAEVEEASF